MDGVGLPSTRAVIDRFIKTGSGHQRVYQDRLGTDRRGQLKAAV